MSNRVILAATAVAAMLAAACTSAGASPTASAPGASPGASGGGGSTVDVALQEWSVNPASQSAPAGDITFRVTNDGPDDIHEFVVLKTDLDAAALPTDDTGAVDESGEGITVEDEIEDIPVGETQELTVTLDAGSYVLICNIYDETEMEAHYEMGMRIPFTVE